jgi:hypothetical protein
MQSRFVASVQSDPGRDVGFDEIPMFLQGQESCQRFPIKDRQVNLECRPSLADPLNDFPGTVSPCLPLPSSAGSPFQRSTIWYAHDPHPESLVSTSMNNLSLLFLWCRKFRESRMEDLRDSKERS